MIDFLMAGKAEKPQNFQSGVVSVPVNIDDSGVKDTGRLVAGTVGFTLEEGREGRQVVPLGSFSCPGAVPSHLGSGGNSKTSSARRHSADT